MKHELVPSDGLASIELLLVEDDPSDADLVRIAVSDPESTAYEITYVARLDDALKKLDGHNYDIMLLDLSLPGGLGLETLRLARAAAPAMPILVMVDPDDEALVLKAVQSGAQDYLIKGSFDPKNLTRTVRNAIERQHILIELGHSREREHYLATHDVLTGLPNRHLFLDHVSQALVHARRSGGMLALLFLDIDHFKTINDSLGHAVGDQLLQTFAKRLSTCLRQGDAVARFGGDEFAVMQCDVACEDQVGAVAQKALHAVARPYILKNDELSITASVGIAVYPTDGQDAVTLLRHADRAMYSAKKQGRNRYHMYTRAMGVLESEQRRTVHAPQARWRRKALQNLVKV